MPITNEYIGRSIPGLPSTSEIVAICRQDGFSNKGVKYPRNGSPIAYIKYGPRYGIPEGEMPTQLYVYNVFKKMSAGGVKVPEIYHAFEQFDDKVNGPVTYIVMEYVHGQTVEAAIKNCSQQGQKTHIFDQVAKAVDQLLQVPPPDGLRLGPARGGLINHPLFADNEAAKVYDSVSHLQRHFNKVLKKIGSEKSVDFSNDKLCLCYADIAPHNFLITDANQVYVIDFEHAAFLPASFMSYIFHVPSSSFVSKISSMVPFSKSGNLEALGLVSYHFHIRDSSSYGLPCD